MIDSLQRQQLPYRVAFFTGYIPPYALPVLEELRLRLPQLTVFLSTPMESNRQWTPDYGELDVRLQKTWTFNRTWKHRAGFRDANQVHFPYDTIQQLRALKPDVIISEELGTRSVMCGCYRLFHPKTPLILACNLSEHTEKGRGMLRRVMRQWLARQATLMTANGESGIRYLQQLSGNDSAIFHFPYASVPGLFESLPLERPPQTADKLLYIGELSTRKNLEPFLHVLNEWCRVHSERQIELEVFGDGELGESLRAVQCVANLSVVFRGHRNYDEIRGAMAKSSILVFPTLADEWGLVVNEALAAGLPVLGSIYSQAVFELVQPEHNGWPFDPLDDADMFTAIERAMSTDSEKMKHMRLNCRQSVQERTPQWAAEKMVSAIQAACEVP